ncbi:DUF3995 domain-containing protein [Dactylosporangium sp. NPDC050688]|uniref:DUF3995 domain-containing protein n=1 Tax=Dactylosporangium sp. NPDC050688 TaxID=3157217 RepID=UPI0034084D25
MTVLSSSVAAQAVPHQRSARQRWARRVSVAAAAWAVVFAAVHVYWLAGGTAGLPGGMSLLDNRPLLIIDVLAVPALAVGGYLAWLLPGGGPRWLRRRLRLVSGWTVAVVLLAHSLPTVPDWARLILTEARLTDLPALQRFSAGLYEPWFLVGGLLFLAATLISSTGTPSSNAT